ncbi:hypothetical protein CDAR_248581 [Caerostris darwini]|uniref:Uncharacterized protein n=1 Tax=Caerostris darwini TaxID=1538125 RepID=A0AAV4VH56_9ARAC|nr:hypothetical protein CDAR_248581 [Caerostris darwini]
MEQNNMIQWKKTTWYNKTEQYGTMEQNNWYNRTEQYGTVKQNKWYNGIEQNDTMEQNNIVQWDRTIATATSFRKGAASKRGCSNSWAPC